MMRQPTRARCAYEWWRSALRGENPPRSDGLPESGWFKTKLVKGGPWVAARIWLERDIDRETGELADDERFACEVDGMRVGAASVWLHLVPISREEHAELLHRRNQIPAMQASKARIDLTTTIVRPYD